MREQHIPQHMFTSSFKFIQVHIQHWVITHVNNMSQHSSQRIIFWLQTSNEGVQARGEGTSRAIWSLGFGTKKNIYYCDAVVSSISQSPKLVPAMKALHANLQYNVLHAHVALQTVAVVCNVTATQKRVAKQTRERQSNAKLEIPSSAHSVCVSCLGNWMFYKQFVGQLPLPWIVVIHQISMTAVWLRETWSTQRGVIVSLWYSRKLASIMSGTESAATGSTRDEASHRAGEEGNPSFFVSTSVNHRDWVQAEGSTIFFLNHPIWGRISLWQQRHWVRGKVQIQFCGGWELFVYRGGRGPTGSKWVGEEVLFYIVRQLTLQWFLVHKSELLLVCSCAVERRRDWGWEEWVFILCSWEVLLCG